MVLIIYNMEISWWDNDICVKSELIEKTKNLINKIPEYRSIQVLLLDNFRENINFYKDTQGGMYNSKMYFDTYNTIKDIDGLVNVMQNKSLSNY